MIQFLRPSLLRKNLRSRGQGCLPLENCSPCFWCKRNDFPCLSALYTGLLQTKSYFYNRELLQRNFMSESHAFVLCVSVVTLLLLFFIARYLLYNIVMVSAIHQHESATGIYVTSLLKPPPIPTPSHPPGSHRAKFPLAICFTHGEVYVSMLLSQFVPPSPLPSASTGLFSVSASPLLPCRVISTIFLDSTHMC